MKVGLLDYPEVSPIYIDIKVNIDKCQVLSLEDPRNRVVSAYNKIAEFPVYKTL